MVPHLCPHISAASLCGLLYPIIQTVAIVHKIAEISSNKDYYELCTAGPYAEFAFLQKMQETLQKYLGSFHKDMTLLVFFSWRDTMCPIINKVKYDKFFVTAGKPIIS